MPLVRAITRDAIKNNGRFSAIVLGIVRSLPFQANMRSTAVPGSTVARAHVPAAPLASIVEARGSRPTEHGVN
jgi:hypothetical protein